MPQPWSSFRLLLTFERATLSVAAISSAFTGLGEMKSRAWIWATVRLIPQRIPISPQWRMNFCWTGLSVAMFPLFLSEQNLQNISAGASESLWQVALEAAQERLEGWVFRAEQGWFVVLSRFCELPLARFFVCFPSA